MADPPSYPNTGDDTDTVADPGAARARASRAKVLLVVVAVLAVVVMVGLHLAGVAPR